MPTIAQVETTVANANKRFANQMDSLVNTMMAMETPSSGFVCRVNELYYTIEANEFMLVNNVDITSDSVFLRAYNKLMNIMGVYANNLTEDSSLIIPEYNA
jgi:hypothetical protein